MLNKISKSTLSNEDALAYILKDSQRFITQTEIIPIVKAYNRILAVDIVSDTNIPGADTSSRDGFCFGASSLNNIGSDSFNLTLQKEQIHAGHVIDFIREGECAYIATGGVLPSGADTVVPFEDVEVNIDETKVTVKTNIQIGEFVRPKASEMKIGEVVAKKYTRIEPEIAGQILSAGTFMVEVFKKPIVAILTSGAEIVMPWEKPKPWQVRTSNPTVMAMLVEKFGGICLDFGIAKDTGENIFELFTKAVNAADVIVTSGGIAMGKHDPTRNMFSKLGLESVFQKYGSHYRPVFYSVYKNKPVFALPGTPIGMYRIFEKFVGPFLESIGGRREFRV
ncbi:MAG: molybdopterin molybdotransferase MoeA [Candidatus Riflebacteria bacterium]|nr:molybdopterin molybdotransferase MoeA [Candidatus Riflebacteria bacterium]